MSQPTFGLPLKAVTVNESDNICEHYCVGGDGVTAVEWGQQAGHMADIPTIRVFKNGKLYSEHPFHNVRGIYFAETP